MAANSAVNAVSAVNRPPSGATTFITVLPSPALAGYIERFWYLNGAPSHQQQQVLPTGSFELMFNLGGNDLIFRNGQQPDKHTSLSGAVVSGIFARPLYIESQRQMMGVHFKPGGAFRFLGTPANALAETHVDLDTLWGIAATDLHAQLSEEVNITRRLHLLESALVAQLHAADEENPSIQTAIHILTSDTCETKIRDLAARLGFSQRHLIKKFSDQVGVTPKVFGRLQRFQRALNLTYGNVTPNWALVAAECGYYDQSHLIHDIQTLSGMTPAELHRQRLLRDQMNTYQAG